MRQREQKSASKAGTGEMRCARHERKQMLMARAHARGKADFQSDQIGPKRDSTAGTRAMLYIPVWLVIAVGESREGRCRFR